MNVSFYYELIVIGAGGTGSYFLKEFSRFLASLSHQQARHINNMLVVDGDIIERKNLDRQAFQEEDIGFYKSSVLADALNEALLEPLKTPVHWKAHTQYIKDCNELESLYENMKKTTYYSNCILMPIIVGCVDNHNCRMICEEFFSKQPNCVYFDSANEFETGEVVFSYKLKDTTIGPCRSFYFPEIKEGDLRNVTELSCTELNATSPQHIATNMLAGQQLLSAMVNLLTSSTMTPGFTFFNSLNFSSEFIPFKGGTSND